MQESDYKDLLELKLKRQAYNKPWNIETTYLS